MPSYVRTLEEVFGRGKVALVADSPFEDMGISTMIVAASPGDHPWKQAERVSEGTCFIISPQEVDQKLQNRLAVILTDDHAPVDNLTAPIFEERFGKEKKRKVDRNPEFFLSYSFFPSLSSSTLIPYLRIFCCRFWRNIWALREASEIFQLLSFRI